VIDLTTNYLGLPLKNPLVASASPLCEDLANLRDMEEAGAAAVVLHSLFEEQLSLEGKTLDRDLSRGAESFPEALHYFPDLADYNFGPEGYLEHIREAKATLDIPVVASLNGSSTGGWVRFAREIEEAGADALELNIYHLPTDPNMTGQEVEQRYVDLVALVRSHVRIPVAVKLGPFFSALANFARRLDQAGAGALVLFNRFYQPDIDVENLEVKPSLSLSTPHELLLRLHWVAVLHEHVRANLAVTGGVHSALDVLKSLMVGAQVAMMTSALLKHGIGHLTQVLIDLITWMSEHGYESVRQMQGSLSRRSAPNPDAFERANYMKVLSSYTLRSAPGGQDG
jgi:dihydroorotate dehydrogenase (fumarate)